MSLLGSFDVNRLVEVLDWFTHCFSGFLIPVTARTVMYPSVSK